MFVLKVILLKQTICRALRLFIKCVIQPAKKVRNLPLMNFTGKFIISELRGTI